MQSMENTKVEVEEKVNEVEVAEQNENNAVVGYGTFLGSEILMSLPLVGLVSSIVMSIVSKRKSFKNYALSKMTVILARGVLSIAIGLTIFTIVGNALVQTLNSSFGTTFDNVYSVVGTVIDLKQEKYSSTVAQLENSVSDNLKPFIRELGTGKYEKLLQHAKRDEYQTLLEEMKSDKYPELISKLDKETYDSLIKELEKAANGEMLDWMEHIDKLTEEGILSFINI
ncbi:MAG: hypothetical protein IIW33_03375 [Oscillospiraceae bacterium]|nr:hypothetical protein [Oscillospiraceae bacterium]